MERTLHQLSPFMRLQKKLNFYELGFLSCLSIYQKNSETMVSEFSIFIQQRFLGQDFLGLGSSSR